jgi:predicted MFS family arabinose efflux permease
MGTFEHGEGETNVAMHSLRAHLVAFTATRLVFNTMHRMIYPFLAVFGRGLGVDLPTISRAVTARAIVGAFSPLLASTADSRGRKAGMLLGVVIFTVGVCLPLLWPTFPAFVIALFLTLVGTLVFIPAMQAYLGDRIPYERRGRALAITELSWSLAFIASVPLMGLLIERRGWRAPFPLLAGLGLVGLIGLARLLPSDRPTTDGRPGLWRNMRTVFTSPAVVAGLAMSLAICAANETVNLIFGVWLEDAFGLKIAALGATTIAIGLGELGGESLVGGIVDRLGKPRSVAIGLLGNCLAALLLPLLGGQLVGALFGLFFFYLSFEFTLVSSLPMMTEVLPPVRATVMAVNLASISLGRAIGSALAPGLYAQGFLATVAVATGFNLLALLALRSLTRGIAQRK